MTTRIDWTAAARERAAGATYQTLANRYGVGVSTVWRHLRGGGAGAGDHLISRLAATDEAHRCASRFPLPSVAAIGALPRNQLASSAVPQGDLLQQPLAQLAGCRWRWRRVHLTRPCGAPSPQGEGWHRRRGGEISLKERAWRTRLPSSRSAGDFRA